MIKKNMIFLHYALKEITRRKNRAVLFILGVIFSITLLVGIIAISDSMEKASTGPMESSGADVLVQLHGEPCAFAEIKLPTNLNPMSAEAFQNLDNTGEITKIAGVLEFLSFEEGHPTVITGLNPAITDMGPIKPQTTEKGGCCEITEGRYLEKSDIYSAVLDQEFATSKKLKVGEKMPIGDKEFEVVGLINSGRTARIAGAQVFIPLDTAQEIVDKGDILTTVFIKLSPSADPKVIEEKIKSATGENVTVTTSADFLAMATGMSAATKNMAIGISIIVIILVALFVIKSSLSSISERKGEIGILKAIGWEDGDVTKLIVIENSIQSFIGGIIGCIFGYIIAYLFTLKANLSIPEIIASYPACSGSELSTALTVKLAISPTLIIISLLISVGLGLIASYIGARQISKLLPSEALRHL